MKNTEDFNISNWKQLKFVLKEETEIEYAKVIYCDII